MKMSGRDLNFFDLSFLSLWYTIDIVYTDKQKWKLGHDLWRSLNAVVVLHEQMRQANDP